MNDTFRESTFTEWLNPTGTAPPFFQVFDPAFLSILGPKARINEVASHVTFAFAHEAPVYVAGTDEIFFASAGGPLNMSFLDQNGQISKMSLKDVEAALAKTTTVGAAVNVPFAKVSLVLSQYVYHQGSYPPAPVRSPRNDPKHIRRHRALSI